MAWRYKEWGGIRKAETKVVRIKKRRRDKGGGRVGEANQQGGRISPLLFLLILCSKFKHLCNNLRIYANPKE